MKTIVLAVLAQMIFVGQAYAACGANFCNGEKVAYLSGLTPGGGITPCPEWARRRSL